MTSLAPSRIAEAAARLVGLDVPEPCWPGVAEGVAALEMHRAILEEALRELDA